MTDKTDSPDKTPALTPAHKKLITGLLLAILVAVGAYFGIDIDTSEAEIPGAEEVASETPAAVEETPAETPAEETPTAE
jgi:hypothetical protein